MVEVLISHWLEFSLLIMLAFVLGYWVSRILFNKKIALLEERNKTQKNEIARQKQQISDEQSLFNQLNDERNQLKIQLAESFKEIQFLEEQKISQEKQQELLLQQFQQLASKVVEEKGKTITLHQVEQLSHLLQPLQNKLNTFEQRVEQSQAKSIEQYASLKEQLFQLKELNQAISKEANNLTNALKGDNKLQGDWGELILERILEQSGLMKGREYNTQQSFTTDEGKRLRPDIVLNLPNDRKMLIDSKVSLVAYEQFIAHQYEPEIAISFLKQHIQSIENHIQNLASKQYTQLFEQKSPDFVLLFIPIETAFSVAVQHQSNLYQKAFEQNIIIVTPSTLLATLKTIESLWQVEKQRENALEIATEAGKMVDKFVGFVKNMENIGTQLERTNATYYQAIQQLKTGKGNLISKANHLKNLGAKAKKSLPN